MSNVLPTEPRLIAFLHALPRAEPSELCSPPGLGGIWKVKHVKHGLERGVLVIHHSGRGLAFAPFPSTHGACKECAGKKAICAHCACTTCVFDRLTNDYTSPQVSRAKVDALRDRLRVFRMGQEPQNAVPALDMEF